MEQGVPPVRAVLHAVCWFRVANVAKSRLVSRPVYAFFKAGNNGPLGDSLHVVPVSVVDAVDAVCWFRAAHAANSRVVIMSVYGLSSGNIQCGSAVHAVCWFRAAHAAKSRVVIMSVYALSSGNIQCGSAGWRSPFFRYTNAALIARRHFFTVFLTLLLIVLPLLKQPSVDSDIVQTRKEGVLYSRFCRVSF